MIHELIEKIVKAKSELPAAQRLVAAYVMDNCYQIPFLSITTLAKNIGVSETTVIKFCTQMGFGSFAEFKKAFSESVHSELVMTRRISEIAEVEQESDSLFSRVSEEAVANIQETLSNPINRQSLEKLLPMMKEAHSIYMLGGRSSEFLSEYFAHTLRYLGLPVQTIGGGLSDQFDKISLIGSQDLVIVTCFQRYTSLIIELLQDLLSRGVPIVLITDQGPSPAVPYANLVFYCSVASTGYFLCYSSYMALTNVIGTAAAAYFENAADYVRELEKKLLRLGVFI